MRFLVPFCLELTHTWSIMSLVFPVGMNSQWLCLEKEEERTDLFAESNVGLMVILKTRTNPNRA